MTPPVLEVERVSKSFAGVQALADVSLRLSAGEVVALIGENGAGKSTLMNVLAGVHRPDAGSLRLDGVPVRFASPRAALDAGIALIHQELALCDNLTVAGALFLGCELRRGPFLLRRAMDARAREVLLRVGLDVAPQRLVATLTPGQRQLVEIARALLRSARVLVLDEPTSSLTDAETELLFAVVREQKRQGACIVWITHRMAEVLAIADRVVTLRDGRNAGELARHEATHERMVEQMVGRAVAARQRTPRAAGAPVLVVRGLRTTAFPRTSVDLDVRSGEIVGIAGLLGSGRTEILRALFGVDRRLAGSVVCAGVEIADGRPGLAAQRGLCLVPEDRKHQGLVLGMTVAENLSLPTLRARGVFVDREHERDLAQRTIAELGIAMPKGDPPVQVLSGGNQQKVVLGKWLAANPRVLLLDEPTRGVDVGARAEIYARIEALAERGLAVLFVSSELPEVIALADRCLVVHEGGIAGELDRDHMTESSILRLATGSAVA